MKVQVQGNRDISASSQDAIPGVTVKDRVQLGGWRAAAVPAELDLAPDDVVELVAEDGLRLWLRPDELAERLAGDVIRSRSATGEEQLLIPRSLTLPLPPDGSISRADTRVPLAEVVVLGIARAVDEAARAFEGDESEMGLRMLAPDGTLSGAAFPETLPEGAPWLLFIHGTASSTEGSFGRLRCGQKRIWNEIQALYPGRVLAFQHRSLTLDPVRNAQELLAALPAGIELHLVTHSRGGLVGELLAWPQVIAPQDGSAFADADLALFAEDGARAQLAALGQALVEKAPRVTRFVRVACPARGTSLVKGRLDRWLNLVFNVLNLGGGPAGDGANTRLALLKGVGLAASASQAAPRALPGVAAMAPDHSPLLRLLNTRRRGEGHDGLMIIGGDAQPSGVMMSVALWFLDAYFGSDHDLVVNTPSMEGGMTRGQEPALFIDRDRNVDHFSYFGNAPTAAALLAGLRGQGARVANSRTATAAFAEAEAPPETRGEAIDGVLAGDGGALASPALSRGRGRPLAVILPGITGSHLRAGKQRIWCNPMGLCASGISALAYGRTVHPDGVIGTYYSGLHSHLERTHEVLTLAYDWRRPIQEVGASAARFIQTRLAGDERRPLHVVGHSMGGLVARMALISDPALMRGFNSRPGSRLVMLGTPNGGSHTMALALLGRSMAVKALAALSLSQDLGDITAILRAWPGAIQLLPDDLMNPAAWQALAGSAPPEAGALKSARDFRAMMRRDEGIPAGKTCYIAGMGETCNGIVAVRGPRGPELRATYTLRGDGTVLWATGIPKNVPAWYAPAQHGDLCRTRSVFPAITDLLLEGATARLPQQPGQRDATAPVAVTRTLTEEALPMIPSQPQLLAMAMGGKPPSPWDEPEPQPMVRVRVVHGDLAHASHPILVGHYVGDPISGSEEALNRKLGNRLGRRNARGLHPGLIGTWDVHLTDPDRRCPLPDDPGHSPPERLEGGMVAGLGVISTLSTGALTRTIRSALLAYVDAAEQMGWNGPLSFSTVLMGSGGGAVSVGDCVAAILNATEEVNRLLASEEDAGEQVAGNRRLAEIEIIEAVEQTAITAWHAAHGRIAARPGRFELPLRLEEGRGGWRRTGPETDPDSWMEVTITAPRPEGADAEGPLHYLLVDGRARVEAQMVADSRDLVRHFVSEIPAQTGIADPEGRSPGRTLFELLWPSRFKEHSLDDRNMRLALDRETAAIPWEMLDDRRPEQDQRLMTPPPAVRFGVLRQLVSQRDQPAPPRRGGSLRALVVGDPRGGGSPLAPLPGAEAEARAVAAVLEANGYTVTRMIGDEATPADVISALYSRAWDVIHIASHGVVDWVSAPGRPARTGIVLGGPPLDVLEARLLAQLPQPPELFFLNCCHLGAIPEADRHLRRDRAGMAASLAVELIEFGCPAVIACGWEVEDDAALRFATSFYAGLCDGRNLGAAVREARRATHDASGFRNSTWGAYQCYGHPGFTLHFKAEVLTRRCFDPAAPTEALAMLHRLSIQADADALDDLAQRIEKYGWNDRSDIASALGDAYAACGRMDAALAAYQRAARGQSATLPVRTLQQCLALPLQLKPAAGELEDLRQALQILDALNLACGRGISRLEIMASLHQRLAILSSADRRKSLKEAVAALEQAALLADERGVTPEPPRLRLLLARALRKPGANPPDPALVAEAGRIAMHLPGSPLLALAHALIATDPAPLRGLAGRMDATLPEDRPALAEAVALSRACLPAKSPLQEELAHLAGHLSRLA